VIEPMLPAAVGEPFDSPAHIYEVLWDGVRALAFVEQGTLRLQDRWGRDVTQRYPELSAIAERLRESGMVIDGEIVCLDADGRPDFARLRHRLAVDDTETAQALAEQYPVTLQAFDLVYRERQAVTGWTLRRRKEMLLSLIRPDAIIAVPDYVAKDGVAFFEAAREHGLEGIVAKEADSRYLPGQRSRAWLTVRVQQKHDYIVGGFTYGGRWNPRGGQRSREAISSLLLGLLREDGRLDYAGEVSGGFQDEMDDLVRRLDDATTPDCPFVEEPALERLVFWCRPEVVATVSYADSAPDGRLRFPVFKALRPDVPPESCRASEAE
jgi:bifunctional non-homologous end joining protein LigD